MAINSVNTMLATVQVRGGLEKDFDPDRLTAREWAALTDTKKVYMCFQPGFVLRMATYEAFEKDMEYIQKILEDCQDIQAAVEAFESLAEAHKNQAEVYSKESKSWAVGGTSTRDGEDTNNSKYHSEQSKLYSQQAKQAADDAVNAINDAFDNVNAGLPQFVINPDDGRLYHTPSRFIFIVNKVTGNLDWGLTL